MEFRHDILGVGEVILEATFFYECTLAGEMRLSSLKANLFARSLEKSFTKLCMRLIDPRTSYGVDPQMCDVSPGFISDPRLGWIPRYVTPLKLVLEPRLMLVSGPHPRWIPRCIILSRSYCWLDVAPAPHTPIIDRYLATISGS